MATNEKGGVPHTAENLTIRTPEELLDFWRAILPAFVQTVDPRTTLFLDELYNDQVVTHTDYESIASGKDRLSRSQQARKILNILRSYSLDLFHTKVAPILCDHLGSVIPDRFFSATDQPLPAGETEQHCLRHAITRHVRIETMADLLCHHGLLPFEDWVTITDDASRKSASKWDLIFDAFRGKVATAQSKMEEEVQQLLARYNVPVPAELGDVLCGGVPCCCERRELILPHSVQDTDAQVKSWLEWKMTTAYQPSPDSSVTMVDCSSPGASPVSTLRSVSQLDAASIASYQTWSKDKDGSGIPSPYSGACQENSTDRDDPKTPNKKNEQQKSHDSRSPLLTVHSHVKYNKTKPQRGVENVFNTGSATENLAFVQDNGEAVPESSSECGGAVVVNVARSQLESHGKPVIPTAVGSFGDDSFVFQVGVIIDSSEQSLTKLLNRLPSCENAVLWLIIRTSLVLSLLSIPLAIFARIVGSPLVILEFFCYGPTVVMFGFVSAFVSILFIVALLGALLRVTAKSYVTVWKQITGSAKKHL